jgi:hypothetical protein
MAEDTAEVQEAVEVGSPEYDQQMADKVDQQQEDLGNIGQTDEEVMLAGKYKSVEELEKAYENLQSKLGEQKESDEESNEEVTESQDGDSKESEAKEVAEGAGIDYSELEGEYQESGGLSDATYDMLQDKGIPKQMVDAYIEGQEALQTKSLGDIYETVGGEDEYKGMIAWAVDNLEQTQIEAFNNSLANKDQASFAIQGLHSLYKSGQAPNLVKGNTTRNRNGGYASKQEMMKDMASPQYKKDSAFRAEVQRRVVLSKY